MGTVVSFQQAKNASVTARSAARSRAIGSFFLALLRTPFLWLGQITLAILAVVGPIARKLGKAAIGFLIVMTLIEWADHWQRISLLEIPASLIVGFVVIHVTSSAILRHYGRETN